MYNTNSYEIAVNLGRPWRMMDDLPICIKDEINGVTYEVSRPTPQYSFFLISKICGDLGEKPRVPRLRIQTNHFIASNIDSEIQLDEVLSEMTCRYSLKICSSKALSINEYRGYKASFDFQFMYKTDCAIADFSDIGDCIGLSHVVYNRVKKTALDMPPLRLYQKDVVDYYKLALSADEPYIQYISYYHVIEYYYDEIFKKKMVEDLRDMITNPDFSYKSEDKLFAIAQRVNKAWKINTESGQGDELESLKYVLNEYMKYPELQSRITFIDPDALEYYRTNEVPFCGNAPKIQWNNEQGITTELAKRIYNTRNALVHSKSGKNQKRFRPYQDEIKLVKEIPLLRAVAEQIIINSSKEL